MNKFAVILAVVSSVSLLVSSDKVTNSEAISLIRSLSSSSSANAPAYIASCTKGIATDIPSLDKTGVHLVVPKSGVCNGAGGVSAMYFCNLKDPNTNSYSKDVMSTTMYMVTDATSGNCGKVTISTARTDATSAGFSCKNPTVEVPAVLLQTYMDSPDCNSERSQMVIGKDSCIGGVAQYYCSSEGTGHVSWKLFAEGSKCEGTPIFTGTIRSDGKCHQLDSKNANSNASSAASTSNTNSLGISAGIASIVASLSLL